MDINESKFPSRLKEARKALGLSLSELSDRTAISKSALWRYENSEYKRVSIPNVRILAESLGVSFEWLSGADVLDKQPTNTPPPLNNDEEEILNDYRKLNKCGKKQAKTQIANLTVIPNYQLENEVLAAHNDSEITDKEVELMEEDAKSLEDLALKDERNKNNVDGV